MGSNPIRATDAFRHIFVISFQAFRGFFLQIMRVRICEGTQEKTNHLNVFFDFLKYFKYKAM